MNPPYADPSAIAAAAGFVSGTLTGSLAAAVAVIAVAWFGLMVLAGSLSRRRGMQLILGCFIIFGAPAIASGIIRTLGGVGVSTGDVPVAAAPALQAPAPVQRPAADIPYDPYAGAALPPGR